MLNSGLTKDLEHLAIFALVLILPKILMRFKIPSGITALFIGVIFSTVDPDIRYDKLFLFLSQIGITSLFLFAGIEVDFHELNEDRTYLGRYLAKYSFVLGLIGIVLHLWLDLNIAPAIILSLGLFTPSAGFILTSLHSFNVDEDQEYWVKSKAISKEVISILFLFFAVQSGDFTKLVISLVTFGALLLLLPQVFKLFFKFVSPYAPNSQIPFLVVVALAAGVLSKELGAYYLVGAFIVGLVAGRFKDEITLKGEEQLLNTLSGFFSVFLPFYFFYAGLNLSIDGFTSKALFSGILMAIIFIPLRVLLINFSLKHFRKDSELNSYKISLSLMPTLVFGLVISAILLEKKLIQKDLVYGLIIYTLLTSIAPTLIFFLNDYFRKKIKS